MALCSRAILLSTMLLTSAASPSLAQNSTSGAGGNEHQFVVDNDVAMNNMSKKMLVKPTGNVDHDFVAMMIPHHQGAIDMARAELKFGHNEELRGLAQNIIAQQEREISIMRRAIGEAPRANETPLPQANPSPNSATPPTAMNSMNMK